MQGPLEPRQKNKAAAVDPEETAVTLLGWLASEPDMMSRFLALSGIQAPQLRQAINDPGFLAGMLDFVMAHEPSLMAFCETTNTKPESVVAAWHHYSGPAMD